MEGEQGLGTGAGAVRTTFRRRRKPERPPCTVGFTGPYPPPLSRVAFSRRRSNRAAVRVEMRVDGG